MICQLLMVLDSVEQTWWHELIETLKIKPNTSKHIEASEQKTKPTEPQNSCKSVWLLVTQLLVGMFYFINCFIVSNWNHMIFFTITLCCLFQS